MKATLINFCESMYILRIGDFRISWGKCDSKKYQFRILSKFKYSRGETTFYDDCVNICGQLIKAEITKNNVIQKSRCTMKYIIKHEECIKSHLIRNNKKRYYEFISFIKITENNKYL